MEMANSLACRFAEALLEWSVSGAACDVVGSSREACVGSNGTKGSSICFERLDRHLDFALH